MRATVNSIAGDCYADGGAYYTEITDILQGRSLCRTVSGIASPYQPLQREGVAFRVYRFRTEASKEKEQVATSKASTCSSQSYLILWGAC